MTRDALFFAIASLILPLAALPAALPIAQQSSTALAPGQPPDEGMVELTFSDEVDLKALIDYVSKRLSINILYDEQTVNKKITIKAPAKIPARSLLALLQSALKMKDLAIVDAEVSGWKRIVSAGKLSAVARPGEAADVIREEGDFGAATAVTQVFVLEHADPTQVDLSIKPFLSLPGANSLAIKDQGVLIVTDYAKNLLRIAELVDLIDNPKPEVVVEFLALVHVQASDIAERVSQMLVARQQVVDPVASGVPAADRMAVSVGHDERTNQLVLIGGRKQVESVRELVRALDVELAVTTEIYETTHVSIDRLEQVVQQIVKPAASKRVFAAARDSDANLLFVTTTPEYHEQIKRLKDRLDVATAKEQSPVRFYRLKHVTALELLQTLREIEGDVSPGGRLSTARATASGLSAPGRPGMERSLRDRRSPRLSPDRQYLDTPTSDGRIRSFPNVSQAGPNNPPAPPGSQLPSPPAYRGRTDPVIAEPDDTQLRIAPGRARVTADESSNTLIVVGDATVQQVYSELIRTLDQRRPQVLIEAKLVVIDTSNDFSLGVELSGGDRLGSRRLFAFSSFGLSMINPVPTPTNPAAGSLAIIPGTGFNGTLVDPDVADAVIRALASHRRARILSAPRVLVNDNAEGVLASVAEVPFTSVNASQTVATTSFAGFAEAGTSIVVRPHIGAQDYLQLEFLVTMNSFTGAGTPGIPPSRQTEEVESKITIPDGHTVIVGGLNRRDHANMTDGIPIIERIPVLRYLGGSETDMNRCTSLFVFIRPIILRDDKFVDLKFLSDRDSDRACMPGPFPASEPLLIK